MGRVLEAQTPAEVRLASMPYGFVRVFRGVLKKAYHGTPCFLAFLWRLLWTTS